MRSLFVAALIVNVCAASADDAFSFHQGNDRLSLLHRGHPYISYVWADEKIPRPYFCDVRLPGGPQVTRNHPPDPVADRRNDDHADFHPGMWLAFGDIGGADVWRLKARVRHAGFVEQPALSGPMFTFTVRNVYESGDTPPRVICEEVCRYRITLAPHVMILRSESTFTADAPTAFGDQEEMGFGVRLATGLSVKHGGGKLLNSAGDVDEQGTWGRAAAWCAGYKVDGDMATGVLLAPDPANFRPSWFHSRDYGLIVANPFGKKSLTAPNDPKASPDSTPLVPGMPLQVGFAVAVFSGGADTISKLDSLAELCWKKDP